MFSFLRRPTIVIELALSRIQMHVVFDRTPTFSYLASTLSTILLFHRLTTYPFYLVSTSAASMRSKNSLPSK